MELIARRLTSVVTVYVTLQSMPGITAVGEEWSRYARAHLVRYRQHRLGCFKLALAELFGGGTIVARFRSAILEALVFGGITGVPGFFLMRD